MNIQDLRNNDKARDLLRAFVQAIHVQSVAATDFEHILGENVDNLDNIGILIATDHLFVTDHVVDRFFDLLIEKPAPPNDLDNFYVLHYKLQSLTPTTYRRPKDMPLKSFLRGLLQLDHTSCVEVYEWDGSGWVYDYVVDRDMLAESDS